MSHAVLLGRVLSSTVVIFFFQAEDGIRDYKVTGVQTCALPIYLQANAVALAPERDDYDGHHDDDGGGEPQAPASRPSRSPGACGSNGRSERRRGGRIFPA